MSNGFDLTNVDTWFPIWTAPKKGRKVLVYCRDTNTIHVASMQYVDEDDEFGTMNKHWVDDNGLVINPIKWAPTPRLNLANLFARK